MYHLTVRKSEAITGYRDVESEKIEHAMRDALYWVHEQLEKREKKVAS